jgi:hypothetical protein
MEGTHIDLSMLAIYPLFTINFHSLLLLVLAWRTVLAWSWRRYILPKTSDSLRTTRRYKQMSLLSEFTYLLDVVRVTRGAHIEYLPVDKE